MICDSNIKEVLRSLLNISSFVAYCVKDDFFYFLRMMK